MGRDNVIERRDPSDWGAASDGKPGATGAIRQALQQVPPRPHIRLNLFRALGRGAIGPPGLVALVGADLRLTLAALDAAAAGEDPPPANLDEAVERLGSQQLRTLMDVTPPGMVERALHEAVRSLGQTALLGALAARHWAGCFVECEPADAFSAALVRDLGQLADPASGVIDPKHPRQSAVLAQEWGWNPTTLDAIASHHADLAELVSRPLALAVHLGDAVALQIAGQPEEAPALPAQLRELWPSVVESVDVDIRQLGLQVA